MEIPGNQTDLSHHMSTTQIAQSIDSQHLEQSISPTIHRLLQEWREVRGIVPCNFIHTCNQLPRPSMQLGAVEPYRTQTAQLSLSSRLNAPKEGCIDSCAGQRVIVSAGHTLAPI